MKKFFVQNQSMADDESIPSSQRPANSVIFFGCEKRRAMQIWDTSYFLSLIFELIDEFGDDESRLAAFLLCRLNEIRLTSPLPMKFVVDLLKSFRNVRLKILVLLDLLNICEPIDCSRALVILWQFSTYGYLTLFYVLDRIKFVINDKEQQWKILLTLFEPLENKKHAAYIILDKTNFYKPNRASIRFGSETLERDF